MRILMIAALMALASVMAFGKDIPWADSIIHTDPVLERGLGPEMVTSGCELVVLTNIGRNGEEVTRYESWTSGRSGHRVECAFRPGEPVEAKCTGTRQITLGGKSYEVQTWEAKRLVRCGNPTKITFYVWKPVETIIAPPISQRVEVEFGPVDVRVKVEPIRVNVTIDEKPASAPPVVVNNWNFAPAYYPSAQMLGVYGPSIYQYQLLGIGFAPGTRIGINIANANTNTNANNNTIAIDGTATGKVNADGESTSIAGNK